jgi:hypothetical protein
MRRKQGASNDGLPQVVSLLGNPRDATCCGNYEF